LADIDAAYSRLFAAKPAKRRLDAPPEQPDNVRAAVSAATLQRIYDHHVNLRARDAALHVAFAGKLTFSMSGVYFVGVEE